jgi:hypothetical protein
MMKQPIAEAVRVVGIDGRTGKPVWCFAAPGSGNQATPEHSDPTRRSEAKES